MQIQNYVQAKGQILAFLGDKASLAVGERKVLLEEAIRQFDIHEDWQKAEEALSAEARLQTTTTVERETIFQLRSWIIPGGA